MNAWTAVEKAYFFSFDSCPAKIPPFLFDLQFGMRRCCDGIGRLAVVRMRVRTKPSHNVANGGNQCHFRFRFCHALRDIVGESQVGRRRDSNDGNDLQILHALSYI